MGFANKRYFGQASTTPLLQHRRRGLLTGFAAAEEGLALRTEDLGVVGELTVAGLGVLAWGALGADGVAMVGVGALGAMSMRVSAPGVLELASAAAGLSGRNGTGGNAGGQGCVGRIWDQGSVGTSGAMVGIMAGNIIG
jgi:hypothetical protein